MRRTTGGIKENVNIYGEVGPRVAQNEMKALWQKKKHFLRVLRDIKKKHTHHKQLTRNDFESD